MSLYEFISPVLAEVACMVCLIWLLAHNVVIKDLRKRVKSLEEKEGRKDD